MVLPAQPQQIIHGQILVAVGVLDAAGHTFTESEYGRSVSCGGFIQNAPCGVQTHQSAGHSVENDTGLAFVFAAVQQRYVQASGKSGVKTHGGPGPGSFKIRPDICKQQFVQRKTPPPCKDK